MAEPTAALAALTGLGRALRAAGVRVGTGQQLAFARAVARLDPADRADLYWAGRACLVCRRDDIEIYDQVFADVFDGGPTMSMRVSGALPGVDAAPGGGRPGVPEQRPPRRSDDPAGVMASDVEALREKDFAQCTPDELRALAAMLVTLRPSLPLRRMRRTERAARGVRPDLRRALRDLLRHDAGLPRAWRRPRYRPRRLVLLLDVSGSMAGYSRMLLQFAHAVSRGPVRVEVFCFGTRLTRISGALAGRDVDEAMRRAAERVVDWDGGTRIGESLAEYLRRWGVRAGFRGAVVVVCSDGLERGDPDVLAAAMDRLHRLAHRVLWVNPLAADARFEPLTRGMRAALPAVHVLLPGHSLAGLEQMVAVIETLGR